MARQLRVPGQSRGVMPTTMTDMASLADIVIDSAHPASLARFWAAVLNDYVIAPYDEAETCLVR
jgi:hypothetical protein